MSMLRACNRPCHSEHTLTTRRVWRQVHAYGLTCAVRNASPASPSFATLRKTLAAHISSRS